MSDAKKFELESEKLSHEETSRRNEMCHKIQDIIHRETVNISINLLANVIANVCICKSPKDKYQLTIDYAVNVINEYAKHYMKQKE